jgi:hypothetical protein
MAAYHHLEKRAVESKAYGRRSEDPERSCDSALQLNFAAQSDENTLDVFVSALSKKNAIRAEHVGQASQARDCQGRRHFVDRFLLQTFPGFGIAACGSFLLLFGRAIL